MGDRYDITIHCCYCGAVNVNLWYAPTCSFDTFECVKCKKMNFITSNFKAKKISEVTLDDVKAGFEMTTMLSRTEKEINRMCQDRLKEIK